MNLTHKYDSPGKIPDEAIIGAFNSEDTVSFSARRFNSIGLRSIGIKDLGWWLPLTRVLPLVGITPEKLLPINAFVGAEQMPTPTELAESFAGYEVIGAFRLQNEPFAALAQILGKNIEVFREDGGTGDHYHIFTVTLSGEILDPNGKVMDAEAA